MESRLISLLRRNKTIFWEISSNLKASKSEVHTANEPSFFIHSKSFSSQTAGLNSAGQRSIARSFIGGGFRALRRHYPNFQVHSFVSVWLL